MDKSKSTNSNKKVNSCEFVYFPKIILMKMYDQPKKFIQ